MRLLCHTLKGQISFRLEVYSVFSVFCILCRIQSVFSVRVFVPSVTVTCLSASEEASTRIETSGQLFFMHSLYCVYSILCTEFCFQLVQCCMRPSHWLLSKYKEYYSHISYSYIHLHVSNCLSIKSCYRM